MSLPLSFRQAAHQEFAAAALWYESQNDGLGAEFISEVQKTLDTIVSQPDRYPVALGDIREAPVGRFPYCVYYRVRRDRLVVLAVFHTSRDPSAWQSRS